METNPGSPPPLKRRFRSKITRRAALIRRRAGRMDRNLRGLLWAMAAGMVFVVLNTVMRGLSIQLHPFQTQFLRFFFGMVVMLPVMFPVMLREGIGAFMPRNTGGQFVRGGIHTAALSLWFISVPHIALADTVAIGFTTPIFIMIGAVLVFRESMRPARWIATAIGFAGVLIVVAPKLSASGGFYQLVMLASAPVFAASFLFTKALTRYEKPAVIVVWQALTVSLFSLPFAVMHWHPPSAWQWASFLLCGVLGSTGHYCLTRSFTVADISATQSVKFLDLVWASALGWLVFGDYPSSSTLAGGAVICGSAIWIARRERREAAG